MKKSSIKFYSIVQAGIYFGWVGFLKARTIIENRFRFDSNFVSFSYWSLIILKVVISFKAAFLCWGVIKALIISRVISFLFMAFNIYIASFT